jgi:prevent-host-death family protein
MSDTWQLQDAKNRFSELVEQAIEHGPQTVTRRGKPVVVVVPIEAWERASRPSFKAVLRAGRLEDLPLERDRTTGGRKVDLP